jgi:Ca2+-binding EF-hand superfamily protein
MLGMFDRQHKGTIGFEDFGALWKYVKDFKPPKNLYYHQFIFNFPLQVTDWQACFRSFDRDNSGNIDANELKHALTTFVCI